MRVYLTKEKCHCNLRDFYENVVKEMGIEADFESLFFDCKKICVTEPVRDEIGDYYREVEGYSNLEIAQLLLNMGPKANLDGAGWYMAETENGFFINYKPAVTD